MITTKQKVIAITLTLLGVSIILFWYIRKKRQPEEPLFTTSKPIRKDITQYVTATGTLQAKDEITVGSLVAGRVIIVHADDNDVVKKDDLLVTLDNGVGDSRVKKFRAQLAELKATLAYQEKFFERQKALYKKEQISQDQFDQEVRNLEIAKAQVQQTAADLEIKEKEYKNLFITSPEDGTIIARKVDLGQMITAQFQATDLFVIAKDLRKMEAKIDADEADVGMIKVGQDVTFDVDAFRERTFSAQVQQIHYLATIKENVITYAVILDVDNPDLSLRPGMTTNVDIKVAHASNALCVENKSRRINSIILEQIAKKLEYDFKRIPGTTEKTDIEHVWIVEGKAFKQVKIELGARQRRYSQVTKGLPEYADVITSIVEPKRENPILKAITGKSPIGK
jgi:HlyD family secretion protein